MAEEMGVLYMGEIPIEPEVVKSGANGIPMVKAHPHSKTATAFGRIVRIAGREHMYTGEASKNYAFADVGIAD